MGCFVWSFAVFVCLSAQLLQARDLEVSDWCEEHGTCESPIPSSEHILLQKSKTREFATNQATHDIEIPKIKASSVPLTEEGYNMILKLRNEHEMGEFIKRVASELGFSITEEAKLNGVVPYYSGKKTTQSFAALTSEMDRTSKVAKGWARKHGATMGHAVPSVGSGDILLQTSHGVVSNRSEMNASRTSRNDKVPTKASDVPLNEEGYNMILRSKNEHEMAEFIKRVASELGFEITEEAKLNGVVPYYSGKKATQSFMALTSEMDRTSKVAKGWARKHGAKMRHALPSVGSGEILLQTNQHVAANRSETKANRTNSSAELPMKASLVSLNEEGYETIAKLKNEKEMLYFVKRVATEGGYQIADVGSLHGVVPYYSGHKATQSFVALQNELSRTSKQPKGWARRSEKNEKHSAHLIEIPSDGAQKKKSRPLLTSTKQHSKLSESHAEDEKLESKKDTNEMSDKKPHKHMTSGKKSDKKSEMSDKNEMSDEHTHSEKTEKSSDKTGNKESHQRKKVKKQSDAKEDTKLSRRRRKGKKESDDEKDNNESRRRRKNKKHSYDEDSHTSLAKTEAPEVDETMLAEAAVEKRAQESKKSTHQKK